MALKVLRALMWGTLLYFFPQDLLGQETLGLGGIIGPFRVSEAVLGFVSAL